MPPGLPAAGRLAIVSRNTCRIDADERLPTSLSERHVNSRASSGNPSESTIDSMTFGPPGWLTQVGISAIFKPCALRNFVTSSGRYFSTTVATSGDRMRPNPVEPTFQPIVF